MDRITTRTAQSSGGATLCEEVKVLKVDNIALVKDLSSEHPSFVRSTDYVMSA